LRVVEAPLNWPSGLCSFSSDLLLLLLQVLAAQPRRDSWRVARTFQAFSAPGGMIVPLQDLQKCFLSPDMVLSFAKVAFGRVQSAVSHLARPPGGYSGRQVSS